MHICYVLAYRVPDYIRTRSLLGAIEKLPGVECSLAINTASGLQRYRQALAKVANLQKKTQIPDIYLLGFRGHELYWPLRKLVGKRPIIIDAMMSPSLALAEENQYGIAGRIASLLLTPIEKSILHDADLVLTDTQAHARIFCERYQLPPDKVHVLPVGAIETAPITICPGSHPRLRILFYGSFLPLHGFDIILAACAQLKELPLDLNFIGTNPQIEAQLQNMLGQAGQIRYRARRWVPFQDILQYELPNTDLCLGGPFGNTPQARRVITGKTFQAMAQAVPSILGKSENDVAFIHQKNCLYITQGQTQALAEAIVWAHQNRTQLPELGIRGQRLYKEYFSLGIIAEKLANILVQF